MAKMAMGIEEKHFAFEFSPVATCYHRLLRVYVLLFATYLNVEYIIFIFFVKWLNWLAKFVSCLFLLFK